MVWELQKQMCFYQVFSFKTSANAYFRNEIQCFGEVFGEKVVLELQKQLFLQGFLVEPSPGSLAGRLAGRLAGWPPPTT